MSFEPLTAEDFMSIDHMRQLNAEFESLEDLRKRIFGTDAGITLINVAQGTQTIPTPQFINIIERNIDTLTGATPLYGMEPTKTWLGESRDLEFLNYKDVNRWFESLNLIRASLMGRGYDFKVTGSFYVGSNKLRQKIRPR